MRVGLPHRKRGAHGPVIGSNVGKNRAVDDADLGPDEDVVDLAVRHARGPRPASHRAPPAAHERSHTRTPEVAVTGNDRGTTRRGGRTRDPPQLHRRTVGKSRGQVEPHEVDGGPFDVELEMERAPFGCVGSPGTRPTATRAISRAGSLVMIESPMTPCPVRSRRTCGHGCRVARPNCMANSLAPRSAAASSTAAGPSSGHHDSCTTITSVSNPRSTEARS